MSLTAVKDNADTVTTYLTKDLMEITAAAHYTAKSIGLSIIRRLVNEF